MSWEPVPSDFQDQDLGKISQLPGDQFTGNLKTQTKEYVNTPIMPHIYIVFYCLKKMLSHYHYSTGKETRVRGS